MRATRSKLSWADYWRRRDYARERLAACRVPLGSDYHTLSGEQVEALLSEADKDRYRKPKNANGSRGRYYHDMLQRRAR